MRTAWDLVQVLKTGVWGSFVGEEREKEDEMGAMKFLGRRGLKVLRRLRSEISVDEALIMTNFIVS